MIANDEPIIDQAADRLGRSELASVIAAEIRSLDAGSGMVVGILGAWGSGKTSLLNLLRVELSESPPLQVVAFNPWMFSGSDDLVLRFFEELASQLKMGGRRFKDIADKLDTYGRIITPLHIIPFVGGWLERLTGATKSIKELQAARTGGVHKQHEAVSAALKELDAPIVVMIDDLDRLTSTEIRDIFKLVRLTASFPNLIYLVAFDRKRVESALHEEGISGRAYLEKIVQVVYDLPAIPDFVLSREITQAIGDALQSRELHGSFDERRWPDVFDEIVRPLINNVRDIKRYTGSMRATVYSLAGDVEMVDVLALEAIRVFLPDVFSSLVANQVIVTNPGGSGFNGAWEQRQRESVESIIAASSQDQVTRALLRRLFPDAAQLIDDRSVTTESRTQYALKRRVADPLTFAAYCDRFVQGRLGPRRSAERALEFLKDNAGLEQFKRSLPVDTREDMLSEIRLHKDAIVSDAFIPTATVLMNLMLSIPERPRGMFDPDIRDIVTRVIYDLLSLVPESEAVECVQAVYRGISSLSAKLEFLHMVEFKEGSGQNWVSPDSSSELAGNLRDEIRSVSAQQIANEPHCYWIIKWVTDSALSGEQGMPYLQDPAVAPILVKGSVRQGRSRSLASRYIEVERWFDLPSLNQILGGQTRSVQLIDSCRHQRNDEELAEAINLADKYLSGKVTGPNRLRGSHQ